MSDIQEYPDVVQEVRGALNPGRLKLQSSNVIFKNTKTGKVDQFQSGDLEKVQWLKRARGFCLKIMLNNGTIHRYDGFKETDFEKLAAFVSNNYFISMEKKDVSVKGWNWGVTEFNGNSLDFIVDNKLAFEIPLGNVSHSTTGKNEVTMEFHPNDDAAVSLMELRFHIPTDKTDKGDKTENGESDLVEEFYKNVLEKADIIQATGDAIAVFTEVQCLTPRGRYDIKIYPTFLQLHGKTFDYKIPFTTVLRLFLLPHKDGRQMFFVVSLDPPIKQGQTRYHFLILLFNKDDEMTIELGLSNEDLEKKYEGKLTQEMSGAEFEVISRVFKAITNRKITVPGSFVGHSHTNCISCSYKAATGFLYPLERGFIFVHKPPLHIRFDEISTVHFARSASTNRTFDFDVETKSGTVFTFVGIEKDEYGKLYDFVSNKKLRVKNIGKNLDNKSRDYDEMLSSEGEDNHDAYLERMKAEGKDRESGDEDDDSDSSDVSFNPEDSGSEVAEEYDSNPPTTSESEDEEGSGSEAEARREKKRKEREKRKAKTAKTIPEGKSKSKKRKKSKDPDKPKRPQSAYFLWFNASREKMKEEYPGLSVTELTKKAGELWKQLEDKTEWNEKAEEAKKAYEIAMEEYEKRPKKDESEDEEDDDKSPKSKKSPKKSAVESRAGSGGNYKSKEYISTSESSSDEDKPLKKKSKKDEKKEKKRKNADNKDREKELDDILQEATAGAAPPELPSEESDKGDEASGEEDSGSD